MVFEDMKPSLTDGLSLELESSTPDVARAELLQEPVSAMMPEEHVPTSLVDRKRHVAPAPIVEDLIPAPRMLGSIGPYGLVRELVRAPAAWIVEAFDQSNKRVVLQVARIRAVRSNAELFEREYFEQMIAETTAALSTEAEVQVIAHGGADRADGTRVLFWVLPWKEGLRELSRAPDRIISASHLVSVGLALARRLVRRHALGRLEPHLSEHLVLIPSDGVGAELVGVPIYLAPQWLEPEMMNSRLSPEEHLTSAPREVGDIWRLGQTMSALATGLGTIPAPLRACIDDLTHPDPAKRIKRATDAVVELEAVEAALTVHVELHVEPPVAELGAQTVDFQAFSPDMLSSLLLASTGDSTRFEAALPAGLLRDLATAVAEDTRKNSDSVAPHVLAELQSAAELEATLSPPIPLALNSDGTAALTPGLEHAFTTIDNQPPTAVFEVPKGIDTAQPRPRRPRAEPPRLFTIDEEPTMVPRPEMATVIGVVEKRPEEIAAVVDASGIRRGAAAERTPAPSPWSDVPAAIGFEPPTQDRVIAAAFSENLAAELAPRENTQPTPPDGTSSRTDDLEPELAAALPMSTELRALIAVAAILLVFGLVFAASRLLLRDRGRAVASVVTLANEVIVDSEPTDAVIVAEADGRVLGRTPLAFLVPAGSDARVLVLHKGYEPQRIVLPERGRIATRLSKIEDPKAATCEAELVPPKGVAIEGVDIFVDRPEKTQIPGAAVVRAKAGQTKSGAWIIRCAEIKGPIALEAQLPPERAELELIGPSGSAAIVDGYAAGMLPAKRLVSTAFAGIRLQGPTGASEERFVPTRPTLRIELGQANDRGGAKTSDR